MYVQKRLLLYFFCLFSLCGGCVANTTPPPLPTVTSEVIPTPEPTVQPTATSVVIHTPSPSIQPTTTPLNIPTATPTTLIATPLPPLKLQDSYTSTDGRWTASVLQRWLSESDIQQVLIVTNTKDATIGWTAEDKIQQDGLAYHWPIPLHWGTNHLYFSHQYSGDGCFTAQNFRGSDLWRINLDTGEVGQVTQEVGYWLAVSPDEKVLAYLAYSQGGLVLRDMASGAERQIGFDIDAQYPDLLVYKSNLIWSPDSNSLLMTAEIGACSGDLMFSIIKVDVATLSQTTVLSEDTRLLRTIAWSEPERVLLFDDSDNEWWLYINSGELVPGNKS